MLFRLSTAELALLLVATMVLAGVAGTFVGHRLRHLSESLSEPFAVLQGALLGVVGLILAFGLSLALSRYEDRRAAIVDEANTIGTTYLRAQTLSEPQRRRSLRLLVSYTESAIRLSANAPGTEAEEAAVAEEERIQRELWRQARLALNADSRGSAPRLYVETLNEMIDAGTTRLAALNNQVPSAVLYLEILGAVVALALLAAYLVLVGRGGLAVYLVAILVGCLLYVTMDLDRPTRGLIRVPDTVLVEQLDSMHPPGAGFDRRPHLR